MNFLSSALPPAPAPIMFTTAELPHRQRLEAWNAHFQTVNTVQVSEPEASDLLVLNENWMLGAMLYSANATGRVRFERGPRHVRLDGHDHWVVRVLRRGRNRVTIGDSTWSMQAGEALLFSLDSGWVSEWADAEWASVCLPRDAFPDISAGFAALGPGPLKVPGATLLADFFNLLEHHLRTATPDHLPMLAETTRALVASSLLSDIAPGSVTPADRSAAQLERVRGLTRQHLASPSLNAHRLARMAGMSRSALYRLLEPHGGVATYIQALRLKLAHALLSDPSLANLPIATVAERAGFFDASAFSRAFRSGFGYPPREARAAGLVGRHVPGAAPGSAPRIVDEDFGALLRRLSVTAPLRAATA